MISYVKGFLAEKEVTHIVVDVNGVGYLIYVPLLDYNQLPEINEEVKIHTYTYVREDILRLYGAVERKTLDIFEMLISVSGIGPKVGMGILSFMNIGTLISAIANNDDIALAKCPGIGKKTAQKVILELKDKFKNFSVSSVDNNVTVLNDSNEDESEAVEALESLGYSKKQAESMVSKITKIQSNLSVEEIVKKALTQLI